MYNSDTLWALIARSLNNESTQEEKAELFNILNQDTVLKQQYDILSRIWTGKINKEDGYNPTEHTIAHQAISKIITRAELERISPGLKVLVKRHFFRNRRILFSSITVIIIIAVIITIWKYNFSSSGKSLKNEETIAAQNGSRSRSMLPDGTTVWLNVGSKLYYDEDFTGATREVRLEGEAFFDVVKQPDRPFIVHTSDIDIKV